MSVYRLGRIAFSLEDASADFLEDLDALLPKYSVESNEKVESIPAVTDFRSLQNYIFKRHDGCLWLDAALLITPQGKNVLIVGKSGAGKSTTAMALALAYDWKIASEDILLIDTLTNKALTFGAPFSLKIGTAALLQKTVNITPQPILKNEWFPLGKMVAPWTTDAHFDFSFVFVATNFSAALNVKEITTGDFLRAVMPVSNVLRTPGYSDKLLEYISPGRCFDVVNGTLRERLDLILRLCG